AATEDSSARAGERIRLGLEREREAHVREELEAVGEIDHAVGLREALVEEEPRGRDMRVDAVEHDAARLVLVEAAIEKVAQVAPALRGAVRERARHCRLAAGGGRIGGARGGVPRLGAAMRRVGG